MESIIIDNKVFKYSNFNIENNLECKVVEYSKEIFGNETIYFDTKKKLKNDKIISIPDGYLLDFTFEYEPKLYIIENELSKHDIYRHIGEQILKFAVSFKASGYKLKEVLIREIQKDPEKEKFINAKLKKSCYRNIDACLEDIIFNKEINCIIVIDEDSSDLQNVLNKVAINTDIITFQAFKNGNEYVYKFTPFQDEIREIDENSLSLKIEDLDTIVVPAREEGFNRVFLNENCWYSIKISSSMIPKIKYIAAYQIAPISAITYFAEVSCIERYQDTNKYILYFKQRAEKLKQNIKIGANKNLAPQSPRYTNFKKLMKSKTFVKKHMV